MRNKISAGLAIYKLRGGGLEVLLVHPGGPFFKKKEAGHWSIPKGEIDGKEDLLSAAIRETKEETNIEMSGEFIGLGEVTQKGGKVVHAWGIECPADFEFEFHSNTFQMEWPPASKRMESFPEVDKAEFLEYDEAKRRIKEAQRDFLIRLKEYLAKRGKL